MAASHCDGTGAIEQVKLLKTNPHVRLRAADRASSSRLEVSTRSRHIGRCPAARAGRAVEERRLARARRSHDRHELAALDPQIDTLQHIAGDLSPPTVWSAPAHRSSRAPECYATRSRSVVAGSIRAALRAGRIPNSRPTTTQAASDSANGTHVRRASARPPRRSGCRENAEHDVVANRRR